MVKTKTRKHHHDAWKRSLAKTITYRVIIVIMVFFIGLFITHDTKSALQITGWNAVLATVIYYFHERIWSRIRWGRN
jgi:uncharacterized membrane protein